MINAILKGIFSLVISLVNLLLTPIDNLIASAIPELSAAFDMISALFNQLVSVVPWVMSWLGVSTTVITLLVSYLTFKMTVPLAIHTVKLAIKWYDKLKP